MPPETEPRTRSSEPESHFRAAHLRAIQQKYSAVAYDAMLVPICKEIDRQKPVPPRRRTATEHSPDPLTAPHRLCQLTPARYCGDALPQSARP